MDQTETNSSNRSKNLLIGGIVLVVILIVVGLFLPPISLGQRLGLSNTAASEADVASSAAAENAITVPDASELPEGVTLSLTEGAADVAVVAQSEFMDGNAAAAAALPSALAPVSDVYTVSYDAEAPIGQVALSMPADVGDYRTLDLYGWQDNGWAFIPSTLDANSQQIVMAEGRLPEALVMMQVAAPETIAVGATAPTDEELPAEVLPLLTEVFVGPLTLAADGTLEGEAAALPTGPYEQFLHLTNVGPIVDQAALAALLSDTAVQESQIDVLLEQVQANEFAGVNLDLQEVPEGQEAAFTTYIQTLADALHAQEKRLIVTLKTPVAAGSTWETGGQNWQALGQIADTVHVKMPLDPTLYGEEEQAAQLLNWATRQIDRQKLMALYTASAVDRLGESFMALSNADALANFGELQFASDIDEIAPGETLEVTLSGAATPLEWDGDSLTYKYTYENDDQTREVWLGSEAALAQRMQLGRAYNVRGVAVQGIESVANGPGYAAVLESYQSADEVPQPAGAAIVWTVRDENDSVLASESGSELTFSWEVGESEGNYTINADFALGDAVSPLDSLEVVVASLSEEAEEPVAEGEDAAEGEADDETAASEAEEAADATDETTASAAFTGDGDAVVNVGANVRTGPGLTYGTISGGADPGTQLRLIGRNGDASWLNIVLPDGTEGWIFASLVTVNPDVDVNGLEVVEVAPPAPAAATSAGAGDDSAGEGEASAAPAPAAAPPPAAVAPVANPGFELGGQSHSFGNPQLMSYAGMNWVKFQHKWGGPNDDPNGLAGRINQAHGNGFKVLLSIPGQPYPDSIDFQSYVNFLGQVAALGPDAIEVWNEMNIDFEWPVGQIDPASYVNNMLAPAYNAIKAANPNVLVISGAPAPTGFFGGGCSANGCDDVAYLNGMAAAGGASYMDCMGVHFNAGATPPNQSTGHPAGSNHYSWYFQPMVDLYYGALGKPLCFTELGYLSGEDFGGVPGRFSWAGNTTVAQHAQWLAQAVSQAANSGKVRMVIIFNVDFTQFGDDPQAGYAMIRPDGSCPSCETLRQVMGR